MGPETARTIPNVNRSHTSYLRDRNSFSFLIAFISNDELIDTIKSLDSKKSSGPSSIPTKLLLEIADLISIPLCKIINISFRTCVFPEKIKVAKVISIFKKGSTQDVNNYRPISLLSIFDKILEKLMYSRLYKFLEQHNVLFEQQSGFRKQKSTFHSLIQLTEQIKNSIENGKFGCGIFIDLKKAFDTVNHSTFFSDKLEHYDIRNTALEWLQI